MNMIKELKDTTKDLKVLYVEDEKSLRDKTVLLLDNFFDTVVSATDGEEALRKYINGHFDIVISDIKMPMKDGVELSRDILSLNEKQVIIIVSAYDDSHYLIDLINLGVSHFISKPFLTDQFLETIYKACKKLHSIKSDSLIRLVDGYIWDKESLVLLKDNEKVKISKNEKKILELLIQSPNQIFPADVLFKTLSKTDKEFSIDSIKSIFKRLRKKLPDGMIENVYAQGYKINL
jgi:DNA-binding response OmpR family regulator